MINPELEFNTLSKEEGDALIASVSQSPEKKPKRKKKKDDVEQHNLDYALDIKTRKCALEFVTDPTTEESVLNMITDGKDDGLTWQSMSDARKTAELALFAVTNPEVRNYVLKAFIEAYKKSKE